MTRLDRVMLLAREHGYRVGLQVGEHGMYALHVRDVTADRKVIAVLGRSIDDASDELLSRILSSGYVPRACESKRG